MDALIVSVSPGSRAARAGIVPGMRLVSVNQTEPVDVLDYHFAVYDEHLTLGLLQADGTPFSAVIRKAAGEDIGLVFENDLMDEQQTCDNNCLFCFIDQMPQGLRPTLYVKDDDARLSFLRGQYITMTNLSDDALDRVVRQHISPLHISVHATDPSLRRILLGHPRAGELMVQLERLRDASIEVHTQIVLCPGLNDGDALTQTLRELSGLFPCVQSVSVVPVGLTEHRKGLYPLSPVDGQLAMDVIACVDRQGEENLKQYGRRLVYAADEFYVLAACDTPDEDYYEGYPQLENGVGMLTLFASEAEDALLQLEVPHTFVHFVLATGVAAAPFMERMLRLVRRAWTGVTGEVVTVPNRLFGPHVTVAGLLSGADYIHALRQRVDGRRVLFSRSSLRFEGDLFLDDLSVSDVEQALGVPVIPVDCDGGSLLRAIAGDVSR